MVTWRGVMMAAAQWTLLSSRRGTAGRSTAEALERSDIDFNFIARGAPHPREREFICCWCEQVSLFGVKSGRTTRSYLPLVRANAPSPRPAFYNGAGCEEGGISSCERRFASASMQRTPIVDIDPDDMPSIEYVANLRIIGSATVGSVLQATADFVGTPTVQWSRSKQNAPPVDIAGATALDYTLTVDDVGMAMSVACTGPYGGDTVSASVSCIAPDPVSVAALQFLHSTKRWQQSFAVHTLPRNEARTLVISRDQIRLRRRLTVRETLLRRSATEWKGPSSGLSVELAAHDECSFTLRPAADAGARSLELEADSREARDLIAFLLRGLAGPTDLAPPPPEAAANVHVEATAGDGIAIGTTGACSSVQSDTCSQSDARTELASVRSDTLDITALSSLADEPETGEDDEPIGLPPPRFEIRPLERATTSTAQELRSVSVFAPPPPSGSRRGHRGSRLGADRVHGEAPSVVVQGELVRTTASTDATNGRAAPHDPVAVRVSGYPVASHADAPEAREPPSQVARSDGDMNAARYTSRLSRARRANRQVGRSAHGHGLRLRDVLVESIVDLPASHQADNDWVAFCSELDPTVGLRI